LEHQVRDCNSVADCRQSDNDNNASRENGKSGNCFTADPKQDEHLMDLIRKQRRDNFVKIEIEEYWNVCLVKHLKFWRRRSHADGHCRGGVGR
jgi:hypothetical protein